MLKLDRLGWAAGLVLNVHGARIGVRVNDSRALEHLKPSYPAGWEVDVDQVKEVEELFSVRMFLDSGIVSSRQFNLVYRGVTRIVRSLRLDDLVGPFETQFHAAVAQLSPRVFIHAGVVGWNGQALVIPGSTLSGKTTLVRALVAAGAEYYSDEFAVLDANGFVYPYLKALGIRSPGSVEQSRLPIEDLNGAFGHQPIPVGAILFSEYQNGARGEFRRVSTGQALLGLLKYAVTAKSRPTETLVALRLAASNARCFRVLRGDAGPTVDRLFRLLSRPHEAASAAATPRITTCPAD